MQSTPSVTCHTSMRENLRLLFFGASVKTFVKNYTGLDRYLLLIYGAFLRILCVCVYLIRAAIPEWKKKKKETAWSCMISGTASWFISFPPDSVMPDAEADSSVNMVIKRSMSAKWSTERDGRHFITERSYAQTIPTLQVTANTQKTGVQRNKTKQDVYCSKMRVILFYYTNP